MTPNRLEAIAEALTKDLKERLRRAVVSPETRWESALPDETVMTHFTGRYVEPSTSILWTIQLIVLDTQRIGTGTMQFVVVKLDPELAELAEINARKFFASVKAETDARKQFLLENR